MDDVQKVLDAIEAGLEGARLGCTTGFDDHLYAKVIGSDGVRRDYVVTVTLDTESID